MLDGRRRRLRCSTDLRAERRAIDGPARRRGALDRRRRRRAVPRRARRRRRPAVCRPRSSRTCPTRSRGWSAATRATHGPFTAGELRARYGVDLSRRRCDELERDGELVRGELRPGGSEREWCDPEVLRRLRRASLAVLRKEVEPVDHACAGPLPARLAGRRPPPAVGRRRSTGCARCSCRCRGWRCRPRSGSATCCRAASAPTRRRGWISCAPSGEIVWIGAGALGRSSGRVALYFREDLAELGPPQLRGATAGSTDQPQHDAVRERLAAGACFFTDLLVDVELAPEELQEALWDLAWAGEATNDAFAPLRAPRLTLARAQRERVAGARRGAGRFAARRRGARSRGAGAGPLVADRAAVRARRSIRARAAGRSPSCCSSATASSRASRSWPRGSPAASRRSTPSSRSSRRWGSPAAATSSRGSEARSSRCRARSSGCARSAPAHEAPVVLAAVDPAQPYGAALPWPDRGDGEASRRPARVAGAYVVLSGGEPILYLDAVGRALQTLVRGRRRAARAGARGAGRAGPRGRDQAPGAREGRRRAGDDVGARAGAGRARASRRVRGG